MDLRRRLLLCDGAALPAGVEHLPMRAGERPTRIVAEGEGWDRLSWKPVHDWGRVAATVEWYRSPA